MFKLGIDIGYSNLKIAFHMDGRPVRYQLLPAGAGPIEKMPERLDGSASVDDGLCIEVNGTQYVAGVPQSKLQRWNRTLHEDYPSTDTYTALFYAALLMAGVETVDLLVTGLPVNQYYQDGTAYRDVLAERLIGTHQVALRRSIEVLDVKVVPQPTGAYMDMLSTVDQVGDVAESRVLIIDPGFFSFDWVVIENGAILHSVSDTSQMASSMILEAVQQELRNDHGGNIGLGKLEQAVRMEKQTIMLFGKSVPLAPYLQKACEGVVPVAMDALRQSMRSDAGSVDIVLLAGGGATFFDSAVRDVFPRSRVIVPDDPVMANVRGFIRF